MSGVMTDQERRSMREATVRRYVPVHLRADVSEWPTIEWAPRQTSSRFIVGPFRAEVSLTVPVVFRETWGTQRFEFTVTGTAESNLNADDWCTREAMDGLTDQAYAQALTLAQKIQAAHPDYREPARY